MTGSAPREGKGAPRVTGAGADPKARRFIKSGGQVDPEALRAAAGLPKFEHPKDESAQEAPLGGGATGSGDTGGSGGDATVDETTEDDAPTRVRFHLGRDLNKRLDKYLTDRIPFMSRTQLQRLIANEAVTVNGRTPKASTVLRLGDVVEAVLPPPPPTEIQPEDIPLDVMHEDDDLIVINKAADIIVHPARSHLKGTMVNALAWRFTKGRGGASGGGSGGEALSSVGAEFARPGVVHRLDRHTSGAIVFAKRDEAHWRIGRQFERRQVNKRYLAVVHGEVEAPADVIDLPIGPHPSREKGYREKYVVRHDEQGKHAVTICRVIEVFRGFTLVELDLKTGRTHQIRVHLSHLGHPIVGDDMYGGKALTVGDIAPPHTKGTERVVIDRQALHATTLAFQHPTTGKPMRFEAPTPSDFTTLVSLLRKHRRSAGPIQVPGATVEVDRVIRGSDASA